MGTLDLLLDYISRSSTTTLFVVVWLSIYFIITVALFISRYLYLNAWAAKENQALIRLFGDSTTISAESILYRCFSPHTNNLAVCKTVAEYNATMGLSIFSIISSTSPFIGLFGTIVSILETFSQLGKATSASLNIIAPAISEALVVTAAGIFVAIPAYSAHILIKRKGYEVLNIIQREIDFLVSQYEV